MDTETVVHPDSGILLGVDVLSHEKTWRNLKHTLVKERSQSEGYALCHCNLMVFWKRQNHGPSKKPGVWRGRWIGRAVPLEDFEGSKHTLQGTPRWVHVIRRSFKPPECAPLRVTLGDSGWQEHVSAGSSAVTNVPSGDCNECPALMLMVG